MRSATGTISARTRARKPRRVGVASRPRATAGRASRRCSRTAAAVAVEQRAHDAAAHVRDRREPARPGAGDRAHEERLDAVVARVGGRDAAALGETRRRLRRPRRAPPRRTGTARAGPRPRGSASPRRAYSATSKRTMRAGDAEVGRRARQRTRRPRRSARPAACGRRAAPKAARSRLDRRRRADATSPPSRRPPRRARPRVPRGRRERGARRSRGRCRRWKA